MEHIVNADFKEANIQNSVLKISFMYKFIQETNCPKGLCLN